jgi:small subunit ribosomal protein S6
MQKRNKYELMVIIKPLLPENVRMGIESKIIEILEKGEGKVEKTDVWGKKHFAYPINKHLEGYYIVYEFENDSSEIKLIEKSLKSNKEILRFLLINKAEN